jgi:hypothetical protein
MYRKKILSITLALALATAITGGAVVYYMFNLPHQDVQGSQTGFVLTVDELVTEYLNDPDAADLKYLDEEGLSGILEVSGRLTSRTQNYAGQTVVMLSAEAAPSGLRCTMISPEAALELPSDGSSVVLKGVIRSGAWYDEELATFEPVILDQCALAR